MEPGNSQGIYSGFNGIDKVLNGFNGGDFIIIGSRPREAKTDFLVSMAYNISIKEKIESCLFSIEMDKSGIYKRIMRQEKKTESELSGAPFYIIDNAKMTIENLVVSSEKMVNEKSVKIIFIDYLGLLSTDDSKRPRDQQIQKVSRTIKDLSLKLNIPIIGMVQLKGDVEGKVPTLENIGDVGKFADDANKVLFMHSDRNIDDREKVIDIIIAKNGSGQLGNVKLKFFLESTRFEDL
jgi:replicative DNA helicase